MIGDTPTEVNFMQSRYTLEWKNSLSELEQNDWDRLAEMEDEDIDTSDIPELDERFWEEAELVMPEAKEQISIRIDREVLDYFRKGGPGYQTRINAVLRDFYEAHWRE